MANDNSPNGLMTKTPPRQGFLGGGVSRKLIGVIGVSLFALIMFILYVISQKGHHAPSPADEPATTESAGNQNSAGLDDILGSAPDTAVIKAPAPATKPSTTLPDAPATTDNAQPVETDDQRRARIAYEQELTQIRQRKAQLFETALTAKSDVNVDLSDDKDTSAASRTGSATPANPAQLPAGAAAAGLQPDDPNKQDVKMAFTKAQHSNTYLTSGREAPLSQTELKVGTLIPATMISGLNSDLPGQIIASVSQNVYDTATGSYLLIPQGSKLYGTYDSQVAYGQDRILVAWTRINYPDGTTLELKGMGALDAAGYAGFADQVDHHYWKIFGNAFVLGMITGATEAGVSDDNSDDTSTAESVNNGVAEQFSETGSTLIEKNLDVQPTITIRSGYKFNIMLNKDVVLEPYQAINQ
ncbi:TrbI/VirB10 family protein [Scandinavium goeteborgense]|uniref:TrbI/VirB10 family protein n=1 Tax=Scandinavium goeteborgense TaxID=1851514 RepID=UPI003809BA7A